MSEILKLTEPGQTCTVIVIGHPVARQDSRRATAGAAPVDALGVPQPAPTMVVCASSHPLILHKITQMRKVITKHIVAPHGAASHPLIAMLPLPQLTAGAQLAQVPESIDEGDIDVSLLRGHRWPQP